MAPTDEQLKAAVRRIHATHPEEARVLEAALERLQETVMLLSNEQVFNAYVLSQAELAGQARELMRRLDNGVLADLVKAEAARAEAQRLEAEGIAGRHLTVKAVWESGAGKALAGGVATAIGTLAAAAAAVLTYLLGGGAPS